MEKISPLKLKSISIGINDLLLDPNNPRFCKHHSHLTPSADLDKESIQETTFKKMIDEFEVNELESSISKKGFTPVDNIFVKKIGSKYLVIEGNRRITAIKSLLRKHAERKKTPDILLNEIVDTLTTINCIDLSKNSDDEVDFILGLRHHGSIKQWGFLPASFNIYKRYMLELCKEKKCDSSPNNFEFKNDLSKRIAQLYSLEPKDVREKLQTYRVYLQLKEIQPEADLDNKFSIIGDSIKNKNIKAEFGFEQDKCLFSPEGADKFLDLVFGDVGSGIKPVIVGAAAGEGNLRDFAYVLAETTNYEKDVQKRIYEGRTNPEDIKTELKTKQTERGISQTLELLRNEIKKIKIGEDFKLGGGDKELVVDIQEHLDKIKKLAGIK